MGKIAARIDENRQDGGIPILNITQQPDANICVIGIDPGRKNCGYAVLGLDGERTYPLLAHGEVDLSTQKGKKALCATLSAWAASTDWRCLGVVCEGRWYGHRAGVSASIGQQIQAGQDEVRGLVCGYSEALGLRLLPTIQAGTAKLALAAYGHVTKEQMRKVSRFRWQVDLSEHEADAAGVALAALQRWERERLKGRAVPHF